MRWILLLGRLLFGGLFIWAAARYAMNAAAVASVAAAHSVPYPEIAVLAAALVLALGGSSVLLGLMPRVGLGLIALFLVGATPIMHAFWTAADPVARGTELAMFMKNVALLGAALSMIAIPVPWPLSLDEWIARSGHAGRDLLGRMIRPLRTSFGRMQKRTSLTTRVKSHTRLASRHEENPASRTLYVHRVWTTNGDASVLIEHLRGQIRWSDW